MNDTENMSRKEAAEFLRLSPRTLAEDVVTRRLKIPFSKIGSRCIYRRSQLREYMDSHQVNAPAAV